MDTHDRMHSGALYICNDEALIDAQSERMEILFDYNHSRPRERARRRELLEAFLGSIGEGCHIEPPFHASWGKHSHLGNRVYANFNLTLVDDTDIHIGDDVLIGPNVTLTTAGHPVDPRLRAQAYQFNLPITVGRNVWIGANAVVLPGITIGENTVIGAGSVVTKDVPPNVVAVGAPARVLRHIGAQDRAFYHKGRAIPDDLR